MILTKSKLNAEYRSLTCLNVAILQGDNVMETVLPEGQESVEWGDCYNMQLQDMMEQK